IMEAAEKLNTAPFITKHNRAGKGLGVYLFDSMTALKNYVNGDDFEDSVDGITLVQDYIQSPEPFITRVEFIGGKFLYAVKVDTSEGFELCPADACQMDSTSTSISEPKKPKFEILQDGIDQALIDRYESFLKANDI